MHRSLPGLVSGAARRFPDHVALLAPEPWTYRELERRTAAFAARLRERRVRGGRVGLLLPNVPLFPAVFHGILRAGASALLLNPLYSPREVAEYLAGADARLVVTTRALEGLLPQGVRALFVDDLEEEMGSPSAGAPFDDGGEGEFDPGTEAAVIYTSAMEGWARGARLTHGSLAANALATVEAMEVGPDDRVVTLLPLIHAFGLTVTMNAPLLAGAAVIPVERFHPVRLLELLEQTDATVICGVPAMFAAMVAAAERRGAPRHKLRLAICGGAPLPAATAHRWEEVMGLPLREGYGLTEASPVCLFNRGSRPNRLGTMGYAFPGVEVTIRDAGGRALAAGEVGEICVRGENVFAGYVGEPGRDPEQFFGDALRTGDLGCMDAEGAVTFRGCLKNMFTRSGFNIYPREIERVLEEDPRVGRATASALPDPAKENEIALVVVPAPGAELDEETVKAICRDGLASYKQPGRITIEGAEGEVGKPVV